MSEKKLPTGITLRKDGRYQWRFKYDGVAYSGYSRKLPDAKKALNDKRYEISHGLSSKEQAIIMDAWFPEWMRLYKANDCKESTINLYNNTYNRYIKPKFGKMQIRKIKTEVLQSFLNDIAKNYSKAVFTIVKTLLDGSLKQARKNGLISKNPMENIDTPKNRQAEKKRALSAEDEKQFLKAAESSIYYPLYRLASLTGMRIGEVLGLQWEDIDFDNKEIHVNHSLNYVPYKGNFLDAPKTKTSIRSIPMEEKARDLLRNRKKEQLKQKLRAGSLWSPNKEMEELVFTTDRGAPIYASVVRRDIQKISAELKTEGVDIGDFSFHTLRHCFATRCIEAGMSPKTLQAILGHSSLSMTMDLYCDVMEETKKKEMHEISVAL